MSVRLLVIDNYDSFTWNLVQGFEMRGALVDVLRNDSPLLQADAVARVDGVVVSPGPGTPRSAGGTLAAIRAAALAGAPLLGVCLGYQALALAFGGRLLRAAVPRHGKAVPVHHDGRGLFEGMPDPFDAMLYHSLAVDDTAVPAALEISARGPAGEIMALRHRTLPLDGVQFHPESIGTPAGGALLSCFVDRCRTRKDRRRPVPAGVAA